MYTFWKHWFIYCANAITYLNYHTICDIRYNNILLGKCFGYFIFISISNFSAFPIQINDSLNLSFHFHWFSKPLVSLMFLIVLPKENWMRIILFVFFPTDYFLLILPSNHLAASFSDYLDTICSGAIFIKFNFLLSGLFFFTQYNQSLLTFILFIRISSLFVAGCLCHFLFLSFSTANGRLALYIFLYFLLPLYHIVNSI